MEATAEIIPANEKADPTVMDLPQIASLSIGESLVPQLKGEVEKRKVVLDNDIWYMVFKELAKENRLPSHGPTHIGPQSKEFDDWLRACRLVSRDFDVLTKKLGFGFVDLSGPLLRDRLPNVSGPLHESFLSNVVNLATGLEIPMLGYDAFRKTLEGVEWLLSQLASY